VLYKILDEDRDIFLLYAHCALLPRATGGKALSPHAKCAPSSGLRGPSAPYTPNDAPAHRDVSDAVNHLRQNSGKDLIVYGGATFVTSLIEHGA
jgi:hypothetical protein